MNSPSSQNGDSSPTTSSGFLGTSGVLSLEELVFRGEEETRNEELSFEGRRRGEEVTGDKESSFAFFDKRRGEEETGSKSSSKGRRRGEEVCLESGDFISGKTVGGVLVGVRGFKGAESIPAGEVVGPALMITRRGIGGGMGKGVRRSFFLVILWYGAGRPLSGKYRNTSKRENEKGEQERERKNKKIKTERSKQ